MQRFVCEQNVSHFQKLFTQLFGGGSAELQLIESDDPLGHGFSLATRFADIAIAR